MKKEIRKIVPERGIFQVTTIGERWYAREVLDKKTGLPTGFDYKPSMTWVASYYPKGIEYMKWLASKGWDEAENEKESAGGRGTKVHNAISALLKGEEVKMDTLFINPKNGQPEELTTPEYAAVMSFVAWYTENEPVTLAYDETVWPNEGRFNVAGSLDYRCEINGEKWIIDFKTSKAVYPSHEIQVNGYKQAGGYDDHKMGILQVGYTLNKKGFKFTEVKDNMAMLNSVYEIWKHENDGSAPKQIEYPMVLKLPTFDAPESKDVE